MAGDLRGGLALDFEERIVAVGADEKAEDVLDPGQGPPAQFQRRDGVREVRRLRVGSYGRDLGLVLGERAGIGGRKVLGPDLGERRDLIGGRPVLEKGIFGGREGGHRARHHVELGALYRSLSLEVGPRFGESAAELEEP